MRCSCFVEKTIHSLWSEVHSASVAEMRWTTMSSLRTLLDEREEDREDEIENKKENEKERQTNRQEETKKDASFKDEYAFKYDEDDEEREIINVARSIEAAMFTLEGCWNMLDDHSLKTKRITTKRLMTETTKLLCTLVPLSLSSKVPKIFNEFHRFSLIVQIIRVSWVLIDLEGYVCFFFNFMDF